MRNYVIINGVNSLTIQGLAIKTMPPITKPIQRTLREEIDGRDGDIVTTLGYGAYDKTIEIGLFGTFDIDEVIAFFNQKGTITFSNEADKVYYFQALEQVDYAELLKFKTANVVLHCQPFKYPTEETPLEEEYEYVTGTGTNITLDNTEETEFNEIELQGNTEQTQYTGKNKLDLTSFTTTTQSGIILTPTFNGNELLYITSSGTFSSTTYILLTNTLTIQPSTSYTLSGGYGASARLRLREYDSSNNQLSEYFDQGSGVTFTSKSNVDHVNVQVVFYAQNNVKFYPMLRLSSISDSTYEPYVGGIPSPNPNYPQDIQVVSGDNTIRVCGLNLCKLDHPALITGTDGTTSTSAYNSITINTTGLNYLYISGDFSLLESNVIRFGGYYQKPKAGLKGDRRPNISANGSIDVSAYNYVLLNFTYSNGWTQAKQDAVEASFLIKKGQDSAPYQPYNGEDYLISLGVNNLIDESEATLGTISQSDGVTISASNSVYYIPSYIDVKPSEDYAFKYNGSSTIMIRVFYYNASKTYLSTAIISGATNSNEATFTIPSDAYYLRVQYGSSYYNDGIQLTKGSTPQTISDAPIEMASIPNTDYKDVFVKEGETWYKREAVGKKIYDGTENWGRQNTLVTGEYYFSSADSLTNVLFNNNRFIGIGNIGITTNAYRNVQGTDCVLYNNSALSRIYTETTKGMTLEAFKTWLGNNNIEVRYVYETPTDIEITNETLIGQLEALWNATSYRGQTNITQVSNDLPFMMEVSALELGSDHLEINNTGNIYSKPTIELEGTGIVDIYLNDVQVFEVDLSEENKITIDTEKMEAYTDTGLANRKVTGDYSTFKLNVGTNDLRFSGALTNATITRYKRWL